MTGGQLDRTAKRGVERFIIKFNKWCKSPKLNKRRHSHSSCILGGNIYVFCGHDYLSGDGYLNSIEFIDANFASTFEYMSGPG